MPLSPQQKRTHISTLATMCFEGKKMLIDDCRLIMQNKKGIELKKPGNHSSSIGPFFLFAASYH